MEESLSLDGLAPADRRAGASVPEIGIALLIDLAKRGEINPWDVQVIDVIDRYLSQVVPVGDASQLQREVALSQSGQAFLYASMLVLLKATVWFVRNRRRRRQNWQKKSCSRVRTLLGDGSSCIWSASCAAALSPSPRKDAG
jgi:hypothetical protein